MKQKILIIGIILVIGSLFIISTSKKTNEIRVRIVPNSNRNEDIEIKNNIRTGVECYLKNIYDSDYETTIRNIECTYKDLECILDEITDTTVTFQYHTLYNKTYNDSALENKECKTLLVIIGEGKGDNWWGTIYPELLEISSSETYQYESLFVNLIRKLKGAMGCLR